VSGDRPEVIDWDLAARIARSLAGNGTGKRSVRQAEIKKAARGSTGMVRDFTGLTTRGRLPSPEAVDRREWIGANLDGMRDMSAEAEEALARSLSLPGPAGSVARKATGIAAGIELGLVSAYMAQRVLGQYDVALLGQSRRPRLLFVAPNLAEAQRRLDVDREPFLRWIALHEATHAVQFAAVPWLRDHLGTMAQELLGGAFAGVSARDALRAVARVGWDPRRIVGALRSGEWMSPFLGRDRSRTFRRMQATMAVVEGYSDFVMDGIGAGLGPEYAAMRKRLEGRRAQRGTIETLISRLLGMEMKLSQYQQGKAFCDEVAGRSDVKTLNLVWSEPAAMPRPSELREPSRWLSRVA
jgi:coenzyme F420 biosynthesis associated uncharacterized protein